MADRGLAVGQSLGPGHEHIVRGERLGQLRTHQAHIPRDGAEAQRQDGHDRAFQHRQGEKVVAGLQHQREQVQLEAHVVLQQKRVHEGGHGDEEHDEHVDQLVLPLALEYGRQDAEDEPQRRGDHQGHHVDIHRVGHLLRQIIRHILQKGADGGAEAPVPLGKDFFEEYPILDHDGLVVAPGLAHIPHGLVEAALDRVDLVGQQPDEHKEHGHDDEAADDHHHTALEDVFCHWSLPSFSSVSLSAG